MSKPDRPPSIEQALHRRDPSSVLFTDDNGSVSTIDAIRFVDRFAQVLRGIGLTRPARAAVVLPNGTLLALTALAAMSTETFAPLDPRLTSAELSVLLEHLEADVLVSAVGFAPEAHRAAQLHGLPIIDADAAGEWRITSRGARRRPGSHDRPRYALLLHTSGTTSKPKLVGLSPANLSASAHTIAATIDVGPTDRCLSVMPLFHIHGLVGVLLTSLVAGASVRTTTRFDPFAFTRALRDPEITWTSAVPSMLNSLLIRTSATEIADLGLRLVRSSSAPLPATLGNRLETLLNCPVINSYGMTEASHQMASNPIPPGERRHGTVGHSAGAEIAILDGGDVTTRPGSLGEVLVRGPGVMAGYLAPTEANATAWHQHDWFRTGDIGTLDAKGFLTLHGRIREIINVAGEKVSPYEVEAMFLDHPGVADVAVFAAPDRLRGEQVCAVVVPAGGVNPPTLAELRDHASNRLAGFKVPRRFVLADTIPLGPTGKIQRSHLARHYGFDVSPSEPEDR